MDDILARHIVEAAESVARSLSSVEGVDDVINDVELGRQCCDALTAGDKPRLKRLLVERVLEGVTWSTALYAREWNRRWPKDLFDGT